MHDDVVCCVCSTPVISTIDGIATGAGLQLVLNSSLAFCTNRSKFQTPGVNIGKKQCCKTKLIELCVFEGSFTSFCTINVLTGRPHKAITA